MMSLSSGEVSRLVAHVLNKTGYQAAHIALLEDARVTANIADLVKTAELRRPFPLLTTTPMWRSGKSWPMIWPGKVALLFHRHGWNASANRLEPNCRETMRLTQITWNRFRPVAFAQLNLRPCISAFRRNLPVTPNTQLPPTYL